MKEKLYRLLGIGTGEESMVMMLLAQSVFLGIFFGAFDISAHSLFLSIFDEKMMARGYVVSGLAGIILTSLYTAMQTRMPFKNFAISNLVFVTLMTLALWVMLLLTPSRVVIFIVFIMLGPLNILALLGFWGTTGRLFTLRQGKRLFGLVDAGIIIGIIISCYAIPVLLAMNFSSHNILLLSAGSLVVASVIQIIIGSRFNLTSRKTDEGPSGKSEKRSFFSVLGTDPYIRIMGFFIALSVMTAFFVQYSFMAVTREQYPAEEEMARFLGLFTGSMMIFTLLIKLLVFSYLIRNYGLKTCLALSPVIIATFTLIAILIGSIMGYTPAATGFMLFFMLLALSRLFSKSLKDSIESPSFKVIYQTIDEKMRYGIQSGMDGTVNEIAALTSGLLLAGLGIISFIRLIHFSLVLLVLTIVWVAVALRLYTEYRNSIRRALDSGESMDAVADQKEKNEAINSRFSAEMEFKNDYFRLISGDLAVLDNRSHSFYEKIINYSEGKSDINLIPALKKINVANLADATIRKQSAEMIEKLEMLSVLPVEKEERLLNAKKILAETRQPQTTQILRLLGENSIESKKLAINMIGKFRLTDMLPELCGCLNIHGLESETEVILKSFGHSADEELKHFYLTSSGNINISKTILRILGGNINEGNTGFLYSRLWSNSRQVKEVALKFLVESGFKVHGEERDRLQQYISNITGIITWNIAARIAIKRKSNDLFLEAINIEIERWTHFLFNLLSITYDAGSVMRIRENLANGTVESVNFALEMIDIVIDDSIKPKLIPLIDVISDEERVRNLYQFFPGEIPDNQKLIEDIINRDYNLLGIWIRACALRDIKTIEKDNISESVAALLFSPEPILYEEAACLIARTDPSTAESVWKRIPAASKPVVDRIMSGKCKSEELTLEKVLFLSTLIPAIDKEDLLFPAEHLQYISGFQTSAEYPDGRYISWKRDTGGELRNTEIVHELQAGTDNNKRPSADDFFYVLPFISVEEYDYLFPEQSCELIKFIELNEK